MPYSAVHKRKKYKNYAVLVILLSLIAVFFMLGIIKVSQGINSAQQDATTPATDAADTKK